MLVVDAWTIFEQEVDDETVSLEDVDDDLPRPLLQIVADGVAAEEESRRGRCWSLA